MRSIELTFDEDADAAIRSDWARLDSIGLRSLSSHTGASNRPHLTVAAGQSLADSGPLRDALAGLPVTLRFGGIVVFAASKDRFVLARQVVASEALLGLHHRVHRACPGAVELTLPDRWTPHVTLARRLTADELGGAIAALDAAPPASAIAARLWDGLEKTLLDLA